MPVVHAILNVWSPVDHTTFNSIDAEEAVSLT